jgi:glycolate oxidase FAD binding subunit
VVKNAAGYNMPRLLVGSFGTLAIVTQVTLLVRPLPESTAFVIGAPADFAVAERLLQRLVHSQTLPAAVELLAGSSAISNLRSVINLPTDSGICLLVGFEGDAGEVAWMTERLCDEWRAAGLADMQVVCGETAGSVWNTLIENRPDAQISVLPGDTTRMMARLQQLVPRCSLRAHAGTGLIQVKLGDEFASTVRDRLRPAVAAAGGKMVVSATADGARLSRDDVWGPCDGQRIVMRAIKDRFDPRGILNPGHFIFDEY